MVEKWDRFPASVGFEVLVRERLWPKPELKPKLEHLISGLSIRPDESPVVQAACLQRNQGGCSIYSMDSPEVFF